MLDPITASLLATGAIGTLYGMSKKTPQYQAPTLDDLRRQNPELYGEFMATLRNARIMDDMAARRQGLTAAQMAALDDITSQVNEQLANRGLVGSSAGAQLVADARSRAMANLLQQAFQERMNLMQGAQQTRGNAFNMFHQATAPIGQANQMNIQNQMANDAARNQFFSNLLAAGANMYGTQKMIGAYNNMANLGRPTGYSYIDGVPYSNFSSGASLPGTVVR
jgi:hypothetical protein